MLTDRPPREDGPAPDCPFCGEPVILDLFEIWAATHEFMLETCCYAAHDMLVHQLNDYPRWARDLLAGLGAETVIGSPLRRVTDDGGAGLILDWHPDVAPVPFGTARRFVARHHAHCGAPAVARFSFGAFNGPTLMGVVIVGNPVARALMGRGIAEVNRLCIRRDLPRALGWNIASMLYGAAAREAERRGFAKIMTYTRIDEAGTSLKASGWVAEARLRGRGWHGRHRPRSNKNAWVDKVRWSRRLRPRLVTPTVRLTTKAPRTDTLDPFGAPSCGQIS